MEHRNGEQFQGGFVGLSDKEPGDSSQEEHSSGN